MIELRNRIYRIAANDRDNTVEKRVSRRTSSTVDSAFYRSWGYYGLTQTSRLIRAEFRPYYLKDRAISVHLRDAEDYLEALLSPELIASGNNIGWLSIRAEAERKDDYPIRIEHFLKLLYSAPNLQFRFTDGDGPSVFNNTFLRHHAQWKKAFAEDIKHMDMAEASHWGIEIVLNPKSKMSWVKESNRAWVRMMHLSEGAHEFFGDLGLNTEADMIFVRRGAPSSKLRGMARDMTSSGSSKPNKAKRGGSMGIAARLGSETGSIHSKRPLLDERSMSVGTNKSASTVGQAV